MPVQERQTTPGAPHGRPLMPTLANARIVKSPLAPRLAATATSNTSFAASSPATPPYARRPARYDVNVTPKGSTPTTVSKEGLSTPVKSLASDNVTPRSASRKTRGTDSPGSTPQTSRAGTPGTATKPISIAGRSTARINIAASDAPKPGTSATPTPAVSSHAPAPRLARSRTFSQESSLSVATTVRPATTGLGILGTENAPREESPMFFHANDPRPLEVAPPLRKAATFFYADGKQDNSAPFRAPTSPSSTTSPPHSEVGRSRGTARLYNAEGRLERLPPSPHTQRQSPSPTRSAGFYIPLSPTQTALNIRPRSPTKDNSHSHLFQRQAPPQALLPGPPRLPADPPATDQTIDEESPSARKDSTDSTSPRRLFHKKSMSMTSIVNPPLPTRPTPRTAATTANLNSILSPDQKPHIDISSNTPSPLVLNTTESHTNADTSSFSIPSSAQLSPTKSPSMSTPTQGISNLNELAANARRDRKVLDLEISNNSLLAINRQLEREVRKQRTELRRFRRLTRAGFLSSTSSRSASGVESTLQLPGGASSSKGYFDLGLSSTSTSDEEEEEEEDISSDEDDEEDLSDSASDADADARHRFKDEKRLRLDLAKHRELLADSTRMNQSLRRCLGWTEELIKDGQRALAYQVRVSDVKIGGRVLEPDDDDDDDGGNDEQRKAEECGGAHGHGGGEGGAEDAAEASGDQPGGARRGLLSPWRERPASRILEMAGEVAGALSGTVMGRVSLESGKTDADSGVDVEHP